MTTFICNAVPDEINSGINIARVNEPAAVTDVADETRNSDGSIGENRRAQAASNVTDAPIHLKPMIDQEFPSEEEAYNFYNAYAKWCGFSIRKGQTRKLKSGEINKRIFICSKEGLRRKREAEKRKYRERSITRCGCPAMITIRKSVEGNKWTLVKFVEEHSHNLETPVKSHCLRSHRRVPASQLDIVEGLNKVGISVSRTLEFMAEETGGRDQLGFSLVDMRNALTRRRQKQYDGSATALLDYFYGKYNEDREYSYEIKVDKQSRLTACFWADGASKRDYQVFNDVICFDTTYKTNEYDMPFGPFIGVNHHKQTVLLGAGLLFGETIDDFKWLFETWLDAMGGVPPKAIVTDQDPAIMKAIAMVFP